MNLQFFISILRSSFWKQLFSIVFKVILIPSQGIFLFYASQVHIKTGLCIQFLLLDNVARLWSEIALHIIYEWTVRRDFLQSVEQMGGQCSVVFMFGQDKCKPLMNHYNLTAREQALLPPCLFLLSLAVNIATCHLLLFLA